MVGAFTRALVAQTVKEARDIGDAWLGLWLLCEEESQSWHWDLHG